eukprot:6205571-Pleurochrysis_carterae.AAC.1
MVFMCEGIAKRDEIIRLGLPCVAAGSTRGLRRFAVTMLRRRSSLVCLYFGQRCHLNSTCARREQDHLHFVDLAPCASQAAKAQHELEEEARLDRLEEAAGASRAHTASFVGEGKGAANGSGGVEDDADHSGDGGGDDDADDGGDGLGDDGADGDGQSTRCGIASATDAADAADSCVRVLSREELMAMLLKRCPPGPPAADGTTLRTIGLVGYPNVRAPRPQCSERMVGAFLYGDGRGTKLAERRQAHTCEL